MKSTRTTITLLVILFASLSAFSQKLPNTLLWRITGKGLQKPSYLFGTMHLQDKRLFYFSDSLYSAIENAAGFAMEIEPNEMMDSVLNKLTNSENSPFLKDIVNKKKYQKVAAKLEKKLGIPADQITKKSLIRARKEWMYKSGKPDDMLAAVDMYLYNIARQQGKWVGGIEDVADQMDIIDEIGSEIDINEYLDDLDYQEALKYKEKMIATYVKQDINQIAEMMGDKANDVQLVKRNIKMARRMDSLSGIRNSFFAVGAAHLPGDSGVIKLLQSRGFTVTPVISAKTIAPENYKYAKVELPWYSYTEQDSAYTIEMPAKPSDMDFFGDELKFKVHADLGNGLIYMSSFIFSNDGNGEKIATRMRQSFSAKDSKPLEEKNIIHKGLEGIEIVFFKEKFFYRLQLFYANNKNFMVMAGSEKKEQLRSADAEHFFRSFSPNIDLKQKQKVWKDYVNESKGFKISMPEQAQIVRSKADNFNMLSYAQMDIANNNYFALSVGEPEKNLYIQDDSLILNAKLDYFKQLGFTIQNSKKYEFGGYPALSLTATGKSQGIELSSKLLVVSRGNRHYTLVAVTEKGKEDFPDVSRFFRSFSLIPYAANAWHTEKSPHDNFSVWSPSAVTIMPLDTVNLSADEIVSQKEAYAKQKQYLAYDSLSAVNYTITATSVSKYYWAENDSAFLNDEIKQYYTDTSAYTAKNNPGNFDSLVYLKPVKNGAMAGYEALVKNAAKSYFQRIRIVRNGDSAYHLSMLAPYAIITNADNNQFFDSFRFTKEDTATTIFINKKKTIVQDLSSKDSSTFEEAKESFRKIDFAKEDVTLLQEAFLRSYPDDSLEYGSTIMSIKNKLEETGDTSNVAFIKQHYYSLPDSSRKKILMLELLSAQKTGAAVSLIKELLLSNPPSLGRQYTFIYNLKDSLELARVLFPAAGKLFNHPLLGDGLISVAVKLADSGFLDKDILKQYAGLVHTTAKKQITNLKSSVDEYELYNEEVISALRIIGDNASVQLLNKYVLLPQSETKMAAILQLLKLGKPVPALEIRKLATDRIYRVALYDSLKTLNKTVLFPKEFQTQVKFAESYLANYLYDEEEGAEDVIIKLVSEKLIEEKGMKRRYYVFKLVFKYEDGEEVYPAFCGPFDINKANPSSLGEVKTRTFYNERFSLKNIDSLFKKFQAEDFSE